MLDIKQYFFVSGQLFRYAPRTVALEAPFHIAVDGKDSRAFTVVHGNGGGMHLQYRRRAFFPLHAVAKKKLARAICNTCLNFVLISINLNKYKYTHKYGTFV